MTVLRFVLLRSRRLRLLKLHDRLTVDFAKYFCNNLIEINGVLVNRVQLLEAFEVTQQRRQYTIGL